MQLAIAVLSVLVGVYRAIPRERQLDLQLKIRRLDWCIFTIAFLLVVYLEFYDFFEFHRWAPNKAAWPQKLDPRSFEPIVIGCAVAWLVVRTNVARLSRRQIYRFQELTEELLHGDKLAELLSLLKANSKQLFRICRADFLLARLRKRVRFEPVIEIAALAALMLRADSDAPPPPTQQRRFQFSRVGSWLMKRLRTAGRVFLRLMPTYDEEAEAACETIRAVLLSPKLVEAMAETRPYFALQIVAEWSSGPGLLDFVDIYLRALLADTSSVLYTEVANNQNIGADRYFIPPSNRLLAFFLANPSVTKEFYVYKSVGDFALSELDQVGRVPAADPYNKPMEDFREVGAWRSTFFVAIRLFDIMVREALFQDFDWHMWLYYFPLMMKKMVRNYQLVDPFVDPDDEWPIRYSYLIYEMIASSRDWIRVVNDLPVEHKNSVLRWGSSQHENNNIPKSSMIALSECVFTILNSDELGEKFQRYLLDMVFELYFELRSSERTKDYAKQLAELLGRGGTFQHKSDKYHERLQDCFEGSKNEYLIKNDEAFVIELESALK